MHAGTLGLGGRIARSLGNGINVRPVIDIVPLAIRVEEEDVDFEAKFPSPSVTAVLDLHHAGSGFRLSASADYFGSDLGIEGVPTEAVEFGEHEYTPAEAGTIRGSLGPSRFAPYLGLGWGNAIGAGLGFALDLGGGLSRYNFFGVLTRSADPGLGLPSRSVASARSFRLLSIRSSARAGRAWGTANPSDPSDAGQGLLGG